MNSLLVWSKYVLPPEQFFSISSKFMLQKKSGNNSDKIGDISGLG